MKAADIHIKMNGARIKVRRTGFPYFRVRIYSFQFKPYLLTDTFALNSVLYKKQVKMVMLCTLIDNNNSTAHHFSIDNGFIDSRTLRIQRLVNVLFRQNNSICFPESIFKTFLKYKTYIINALEYPYSNAKLEATNKLIKDMKRQAFGFRNFKNFKTKILIALNITKERTNLILSRA